MELNARAFGHSFAVVTGAFYILVYIVNLITPQGFSFFFNAQFLGADVTSLLPAISVGDFLAILITITVTGWIIGYFIARSYNCFLR